MYGIGLNLNVIQTINVYSYFQVLQFSANLVTFTFFHYYRSWWKSECLDSLSFFNVTVATIEP